MYRSLDIPVRAVLEVLIAAKRPPSLSDVSNAIVASPAFLKAVTSMPVLRELYARDISLDDLCTKDTPHLKKALKTLKTILWYGPPRHWLNSVCTPSSAHLQQFCLSMFQ